MPTSLPIVVRKTTRGDWTARYHDAMFAVRGETAEAAIAGFCQFKAIDRTRLEEATPKNAPPDTIIYRQPLAPAA